MFGDMTEARAFALFRGAVLDVVEAPTPANVQRYLAASSILERSRGKPKRRRGRRRSDAARTA
jgi:hypothetical protein